MLAEYEAMSLRHTEEAKTVAEAQLDEALQLLAPTAFAGKVVCRDEQRSAIRSFINRALAGRIPSNLTLTHPQAQTSEQSQAWQHGWLPAANSL